MDAVKREPITAASIPQEWIETVRAIAQRDGHAVRAGAGATIEMQSINTGKFGILMLYGSADRFASDADRDQVLEQIVGRAK